jgi:hypothetical protein
MNRFKSDQTELKIEKIMETMDRYKVFDFPLDAEMIEAVFNVPLHDAEIILNDYKKGE